MANLPHGEVVQRTLPTDTGKPVSPALHSKMINLLFLAKVKGVSHWNFNLHFSYYEQGWAPFHMFKSHSYFLFTEL